MMRKRAVLTSEEEQRFYDIAAKFEAQEITASTKAEGQSTLEEIVSNLKEEGWNEDALTAATKEFLDTLVEETSRQVVVNRLKNKALETGKKALAVIAIGSAVIIGGYFLFRPSNKSVAVSRVEAIEFDRYLEADREIIDKNTFTYAISNSEDIEWEVRKKFDFRYGYGPSISFRSWRARVSGYNFEQLRNKYLSQGLNEAFQKNSDAEERVYETAVSYLVQKFDRSQLETLQPEQWHEALRNATTEREIREIFDARERLYHRLFDEIEPFESRDDYGARTFVQAFFPKAKEGRIYVKARLAKEKEYLREIWKD